MPLFGDRDNETCTSTDCSMAPLRVRHYRWQCGSADLTGKPEREAAPAQPASRAVPAPSSRPVQPPNRRRWRW